MHLVAVCHLDSAKCCETKMHNDPGFLPQRHVPFRVREVWYRPGPYRSDIRYTEYAFVRHGTGDPQARPVLPASAMAIGS